ncbi:bZIP transcription factor [Tanacetum coccineum]
MCSLNRNLGAGVFSSFQRAIQSRPRKQGKFCHFAPPANHWLQPRMRQAGRDLLLGSHSSTLDRLYAWERKLYDGLKEDRVSLPDLKTVDQPDGGEAPELIEFLWIHRSHCSHSCWLLCEATKEPAITFLAAKFDIILELRYQESRIYHLFKSDYVFVHSRVMPQLSTKSGAPMPKWVSICVSGILLFRRSLHDSLELESCITVAVLLEHFKDPWLFNRTTEMIWNCKSDWLAVALLLSVVG